MPLINRREHKHTIIISDGDVSLIKARSHYYFWLTIGIDEGELELFIPLHNELVYYCNCELDTCLTSRNCYYLRESSSIKINISCGRNMGRRG